MAEVDEGWLVLRKRDQHYLLWLFLLVLDLFELFLLLLDVLNFLLLALRVVDGLLGPVALIFQLRADIFDGLSDLEG